jgi:hypothetical protein
MTVGEKFTKDNVTNEDVLGLRIRAGRAGDQRAMRSIDRWMHDRDQAALADVLRRLNEGQ